MADALYNTHMLIIDGDIWLPQNSSNSCRNLWDRPRFSEVPTPHHPSVEIHMDTHEYPWKSKDIHGYTMIPMVIHGNPRMSMDIHGYPWIFIDIHGYPLIPVDSHGYLWISMDTDGNP